MDWWTLLCWTGAGLLTLLGLAAMHRALLHDRSRGRRRCRKCWYDMTGSPGLQCPECGRQFRHERQLLATRRRWGRAAAGALLLALAAAAALGPRIRRDGWLSVVPAPALLLILSMYEDESDAVWQRVRGRLWNQTTAAGLTTWEKLLIARHCGRKLMEDEGQAALAAQIATGTPGMGHWEYLTALQALGKDARPAVAGVEHVVRTGSTFLRQQAIVVLGEIGAPAQPALPALLELLDDTRQDVTLAAAAATAVGKILADAGDSGQLVRLLRHDARWMRFAALSGLAAIGPEASSACPAIAEAAKADGWLAAPAVHTLVQIAQGAPEALEDLLASDTPVLRREAARGLGQLGAKAAPAAPSLVPALADADPSVRLQAAAALGRIGPGASAQIPAMAARLPQEPDSLVRLELVMAFRNVGPADERAVAALADALRDPDRTVRNAAARELEALGPAAAPARVALERTAADEHELEFIREAAADALRAISGK